jgi:hypothetical protein
VIEVLGRVLLSGLAAWRVAALLSYEVGPFEIFERLRHAIAPDGRELSRWRQEFDRLLSCVWCLSPWLAVLAWYTYGAAPAVIAVLAVAALVPITERIARG